MNSAENTGPKTTKYLRDTRSARYPNTGWVIAEEMVNTENRRMAEVTEMLIRCINNGSSGGRKLP